MSQTTHALLISIDGLRPDALALTHTPVLDRLIADGASSMTCRADMPSVTLPCHQTMLRGVSVGRHGVTTNTFHPLARPVPSLLDAAHTVGLKTGTFYNWEQLRDLSDPGSLDVSCFSRELDVPAGDDRVTEVAVECIRRYDLGLAFVYLGHLDLAGHREGWMSEAYLNAIANADGCIGRLIDCVEQLGGRESAAVLVTADHGGHEKVHGTETDEDMLVPWVLWGAGVRCGHALEGEVDLRDTCTTLAHLLGLPRSAEWEGKVVTEALLPRD
ncbi:alkaline phosphatase family protein [bacterium]|nr:alkaline phosphatase family protein [bacterium]